MTTNATRRKLLGVCALGVSAAVAGCTGVIPFVGERTEFDRTFDMTTGRITVETDSGSATVSRTDADEIQLHGVKEASSVFTDIEDMTIETRRDGDHLFIVADSGGGSFLGLGGGSISLDVGVREGVAVERISAVNGTVTATDVAGDARLESTNGAVTAHNVDGFVSLSSTNGPVRARSVAGLDGATTTNGDITAALALDLDTTVVVETTNGGITATGLPLRVGWSGDNSIRGTLGGGTHELTIETVNGDITLTRLR